MHRLSSRATLYYKCILPFLFVGGLGAGTAGMFAGVFRDEKGNPPPQAMCWGFLGATVAGAAFLYWGCIRLKAVWLENNHLWVSNYGSSD
jgi:protein-S-isoprenylcysteine O-methyltransferase Ste14